MTTGLSSARRAPTRVLTALGAAAVLVTATPAAAAVVLALPPWPAEAATVPATPPPTSPPPTSPTSSPAPLSPPAPTSPPAPPPATAPSPTPPATASGLAIVRITGIPKVVPPGSTIHPTVEITQTTPYTLSVLPQPIVDAALPRGVPASRQDITLRMQDPVTGQWVDGEQEAVAWGTGVELNFTFGDKFAVPPGGKLVLPFEMVFGPAAPLTEYTPEFGAQILVRDWPSTVVNQEVSGWGDQVAFLLGTPPPPVQGKVDPYALGGGGGGGAAGGAGAGPAAPSLAASGAVTPTGGMPQPPSPIPLLVNASQAPQIDADRVAVYRTRELPSVAGAVLASWLLLLGGYLRRVRRRRNAAEPDSGTAQSR